jgi:hypothetical protein
MRARLIASVIGAGLAALLVAGGPAVAQSSVGPTAGAGREKAAPPANWFKVTGLVLGLSGVSAKNIWASGEFDPNKSDSEFDTVAHWNGRSWTVMRSPLLTQANIDDTDNTTSIAAISNTDVWAANTNGILHWNGKKWRVSYATPPNSAGISLVAAGSARNVWAVGYSYTNAGNSVLNFYHWTGAAWYVVPTPFPASNTKEAEDVYAMAVTGNTAWAFGSEQAYLGSSTEYPLLLHWNGTQWKVVRYPLRDDTNQAADTVAAGPHGALWVTGIEMNESLYWSGKQWRTFPLPGYDLFDDASFIPHGTAWAVGVGDSAVIAHWASGRWNLVGLPSWLPVSASLSGVLALSPANAWAVGMSGECLSPQDCETVILHWNGKAWS